MQRPETTNPPLPDRGLQYELVYRESLRAIEGQEGTLDELRSRAGTLIAAASLVTSFLGADALRNGLSRPESLALGAFLVSVALAVYVLVPQGNWKFKLSTKILLDQWVAVGVSMDEMYVGLARQYEEDFDFNARRLNWLQWAFTGSAVAIGVEVVCWTVALIP